jgi:hypothetical protein
MVRGVFGVVGGAILWSVAFVVLAWSLAAAWPAYALSGREYFATGIFGFTVAMAICNALFWLLADVGAGWLAVVIARRREAAWVLAALLMGFLCFIHLYHEWERFPGWYNLAVALPSGAAVLLGGRLAARFVQGRPLVRR